MPASAKWMCPLPSLPGHTCESSAASVAQGASPPHSCLRLAKDLNAIRSSHATSHGRQTASGAAVATASTSLRTAARSGRSNFLLYRVVPWLFAPSHLQMVLNTLGLLTN